MHITVIPSDNIIIVDGEVLAVRFTAPENLRALQWNGESGHMEFTDRPNRALAPAEFEELVAPYLAQWQAEKARLDAEARREEEEANRPPSLEEARAAKLAEVMSAYQAAFAPIEAVYPSAEREGWPVQETEAKAVLGDPAADPAGAAPVLSMLVLLRGRNESVADLAAKVLTNATTWRALYAALTGQQQRMYADVTALDTVEAVLAYAVAYQLPDGL